MKEITQKAVGYREKLGLFVLCSPDILFLILFCGLGGVAVGWIFIGVGALFALVPMIGFAVYYQLQQKLKKADSV
ncbi:hypothetical protein NHH88_28700 [Oxalobacteraceae bacterium OTU3CAMAD1]|nr:hypothetical protein NHH88_28700 [Oxalobacteraceae bacterium OTU3CAMAD1]